jgi:hypothetical protein
MEDDHMGTEDYNSIFSPAWARLLKKESTELARKGGNAVTRAYAKAGLFPFVEGGPPQWWEAAERIGKVGRYAPPGVGGGLWF